MVPVLGSEALQRFVLHFGVYLEVDVLIVLFLPLLTSLPSLSDFALPLPCLCPSTSASFTGKGASDDTRDETEDACPLVDAEEGQLKLALLVVLVLDLEVDNLG